MTEENNTSAMKERLNRRPSVLPISTGTKDPEKEVPVQETEQEQTTAVDMDDINIDLKLVKKKADPWKGINIRVPTLAKYEAYARKKGTTAQNVITQLLDSWIEAKMPTKKK